MRERQNTLSRILSSFFTVYNADEKTTILRIKTFIDFHYLLYTIDVRFFPFFFHLLAVLLPFLLAPSIPNPLIQKIPQNKKEINKLSRILNQKKRKIFPRNNNNNKNIINIIKIFNHKPVVELLCWFWHHFCSSILSKLSLLSGTGIRILRTNDNVRVSSLLHGVISV